MHLFSPPHVVASSQKAPRPPSANHNARIRFGLGIKPPVFNHVLANVDESNCLDVLLFSHLIASHVFWETFAPTDSDFGIFLDKLIACVRMLRGMNVVVRTWWDALVKQQMAAILLEAEEQQYTPKPSRQECEPPRAMVEAADLSSASIQTYHESLEHLQKYFDGENAL